LLIFHRRQMTVLGLLLIRHLVSKTFRSLTVKPVSEKWLELSLTVCVLVIVKPVTKRGIAQEWATAWLLSYHAGFLIPH